MVERDMEDLIASYPDDFFPRQQFSFVGRQCHLAGVGRVDLLFQDRFRSRIVMEIKARTLKYEDATQVAKYRDELMRRGVMGVVMWLVAAHIPRSVRDFLDELGIEYNEIHPAEFRRVAERHGFPLGARAEPCAFQLSFVRAKRVPEVSMRDARGEEVADPSLARAVRRFGGAEWTLRDLADALGVHKSNAWRTMRMWQANGIVERVRGPKPGRRGRLARYRFIVSRMQ